MYSQRFFVISFNFLADVESENLETKLIPSSSLSESFGSIGTVPNKLILNS